MPRSFPHTYTLGGQVTHTALNETESDLTGVWSVAEGAVARLDRDKTVNVMTYGATVNGTTDDTTAVQNAINATPVGGVCLIPATGQPVRISSPLVVPAGRTLLGSHYSHLDRDVSNNPATISPLASFTGNAAVRLVGSGAGSVGFTNNGQQRVANLVIDGSALATGTAAGIEVFGSLTGAQFVDVSIRDVPGVGFLTSYDNGVSPVGYPFSMRLTRVMVDNPGLAGFSLNNTTDTTFLDCQAFDAGGAGWYIGGDSGSLFIGCRSEWNGQQGFYCDNVGGGLTMIGCRTDSNFYDGFHLLGGASGKGTYQLSGCRAERDGRNGGTDSGFYVHDCTIPVYLDNCVSDVSRNDDGTGSYRPTVGMRFASNTSPVVVASGSAWGATTSWLDGGSNTDLRRGTKVLLSTGNTGSRVYQKVDNKGTATVASGTTSIAVTHGLVATPNTSDIRLTPTNSLGSATKFWVSATTSTTFTISVNVDPGATTATFAWQAQLS